MKSETKARAWEASSEWLRTVAAEVNTLEARHIRGVIVPHLLRQAERIRNGSKARREQLGQR